MRKLFAPVMYMFLAGLLVGNSGLVLFCIMGQAALKSVAQYLK